MNPHHKITLPSILLSAFLLHIHCHPKIHQSTTNNKPVHWQEFVMGADLSYVNEIEDYGGVYKDSGKVKDPFLIFRDHGANLVRVRLWHNPSWQAALNNGRLYNDIHDVAKTIRRAHAAGMAVNLNLHYSDTWADPDHQPKPEAWKSLSYDLLKDSVYRYTLEVLNYLKSQDLVPEMIQVGNENNSGMLWPEGKVVDNNWKPFCGLLQSGINAVRDFSKTSPVKPQIILHVAQFQHADHWAKEVNKEISDYDVLGVSHYQKWSTISDLAVVGRMIAKLKSTYGKKVMIVETAYPWTHENADSYSNIISGRDSSGKYGVSKEEQLRYLKDLTQEIINGGGSGIMYWEPAWITSKMRDRWGQGSSWENNAFFDFEGNVLPGIDFMKIEYKGLKK